MFLLTSSCFAAGAAFLRIETLNSVTFTTDKNGVPLTPPVTVLLAGSGEFGNADGEAKAASFKAPYGLAISPDGTLLLVADVMDRRIRQIVIATGAVSTVAGSSEEGDADGTGAAARFHNPLGLAISPDGTRLFVADSDNNRIRQIQAA